MAKPKFGSLYQRKKKLADGTVKTLPIWWLKYRRNGQVFRESSESTDRQDAERLLKRRLGEIATGKFGGLGPERIRFAELAAEVIEDYRVNGKSSIKDVKSRLRLHLLPSFGHMRAADISTSRINSYVASRLDEGAPPATINRELAIVNRAFHLGMQATAVQDRTGLLGREVKTFDLLDGVERFQVEVSLSELSSPVQVIPGSA